MLLYVWDNEAKIYKQTDKVDRLFVRIRRLREMRNDLKLKNKIKNYKDE